jgi:hypothetical protein
MREVIHSAKPAPGPSLIPQNTPEIDRFLEEKQNRVSRGRVRNTVRTRRHFLDTVSSAAPLSAFHIRLDLARGRGAETEAARVELKYTLRYCRLCWAVGREAGLRG